MQLHKLRHFCSAFSRRHVLPHLGTKCHGASHIVTDRLIMIGRLRCLKETKPMDMILVKCIFQNMFPYDLMIWLEHTVCKEKGST